MSWGIRITILYVAFSAMILFLVFKTMNEKVELVSSDYYQQELQYQDRIDQQQQSGTLAEQPKVAITGNNVRLQFPETLAKETISGTVKFYRPSDSSKDFSTALKVDSSGTQFFPITNLEKGIYQLQLTWSAEGKNYYNELPIYIP